jgi:hypothetical protein
MAVGLPKRTKLDLVLPALGDGVCPGCQQEGSCSDTNGRLHHDGYVGQRGMVKVLMQVLGWKISKLESVVLIGDPGVVGGGNHSPAYGVPLSHICAQLPLYNNKSQPDMICKRLPRR